MPLEPKPKPYSYFDTPDGEDLPQKLECLIKPTTLFTLAISTIDVLLYSHPKGYLQTLGRYAHFAWPIFGAATTFVVTTNTAASLRQKDDKINWFLGGAAAGLVVGAWTKKPGVTFHLALLFGVAGALKKAAVQNGYVILPTHVNRIYGDHWSCRHDYTLLKDVPRNWTTGK